MFTEPQMTDLSAECKATGPRVEDFYHDTKQEAIDTAASKWSERQMPR